MGRLLILTGAIIGVVWLLYRLRSIPSARVAETLRKVALWGGIGLLAFAVLTGRLNPLFAAFAGLVALLMRLVNLMRLIPALQRVARSFGQGIPGEADTETTGPGDAGSHQTSSIRTRFLAMTLDHATGVMDGEVLEGPFSGQRLSVLALDQLLRMLELYRDADPQSAAVLEAYLDRERDEDWRERADAAGRGRGGGGGAEGDRMGRGEALAILGLESGADAEAIRAAHRRLIQKLHPDRGGSDYLAAKINEAKRVLLGGEQ